MFDKALIIVCLLSASQSHSPLPLSARILNGRNANPGEFPYRVSMQWSMYPFSSSYHFCGGAIINEEWILTHAECVKFIKKYVTLRTIVIKAGKHDLGIVEESEQTSSIDMVHLHQHYDYDSDNFRQDVGLVKVYPPFVFNDRVAKIELFKMDKEPLGIATLSGWGEITNKQLFPDYPTILQATSVSVLSHENCIKELNKTAEEMGRSAESLVYTSEFCTEPFTGGAKPCGGDFGGPITMTDEKGSTKLVGLVKWGSLSCVRQRHPLIFVRTSFFLDWINNIVYGIIPTTESINATSTEDN